MVVFAMLTIAFMFYLCFFITGKRKREYGLLTVLGLEHKHLVRLVFLENSILFFLNIIFSSLGGVVFYKLVQLAFIRILEGPIDHDITLCPEGLLALVTLYFIVYLIIFLFQVIRIIRNKPLELMRSKRVRDRFTKIDMLLAIMGILLMGLSYILSFSIPESVDVARFELQTVKFITAVIFAVISTFLLFSSGSALILTLIRRKRGMYLGRIGFITISTLYSRMRRNGIGLAVVSMLCSLVMIFTSALLTFFISIDEYLSNMGPITYEVVGDTALQEFTVNINDDIPGDLRIVSTSAYEPVYVKNTGHTSRKKLISRT
jgi:putative ABC transport system permease protein